MRSHEKGAAMIRWLIAGVALMIASAGQAASSEREFTAGVLERLRAAMPEVEMRIRGDDPLVIELKYEKSWSDGEFNLHRVHALCEEIGAEECDAFLTQYVSVAAVAPPEPVAENLRVAVRHQGYLDYLGENLPAGERPVSRRIGDDLVALLAFANEHAIAFATEGQVSALDMAPAAAWRLARRQTSAGLPELPFDVNLAEHVVGIEDYDLLPSLLLETQGWRRIAEKTGPDLFVAVASDFSVWIGVMPDGPRLQEFKQVVRDECDAAERCISPNVYRFRAGKWVIAE
jgi:hypothetical protein